MTTRSRKLRKRYGGARARKTRICVVSREVLINSEPGGSKRTLVPGDRIEVGGSAANKAFLIAYRVQQLGRGWETLGPFAVIAKDACKRERAHR